MADLAQGGLARAHVRGMGGMRGARGSSGGTVDHRDCRVFRGRVCRPATIFIIHCVFTIRGAVR